MGDSPHGFMGISEGCGVQIIQACNGGLWTQHCGIFYKDRQQRRRHKKCKPQVRAEARQSKVGVRKTLEKVHMEWRVVHKGHSENISDGGWNRLNFMGINGWCKTFKNVQNHGWFQQQHNPRRGQQVLWNQVEWIKGQIRVPRSEHSSTSLDCYPKLILIIKRVLCCPYVVSHPSYQYTFDIVVQRCASNYSTKNILLVTAPMVR